MNIYESLFNSICSSYIHSMGIYLYHGVVVVVTVVVMGWGGGGGGCCCGGGHVCIMMCVYIYIYIYTSMIYTLFMLLIIDPSG